MTALRSLFSYLQGYGYTGANPAHSDFVDAPAVARDGKTVALSPEHCRRLLDAPKSLPTGIRDQALLAVLAYTGCRVGELTRLKSAAMSKTECTKFLKSSAKVGKSGWCRCTPRQPNGWKPRNRYGSDLANS